VCSSDLTSGADVLVIAPEVCDELRRTEARIETRPYDAGDLEGAAIAVAATDEPNVNDRVARDAAVMGVWINRTDAPEEGDVIVPAHRRVGLMTVSVYSGGVSARAAATIRDEMLTAIDASWRPLLDTAAPFRGEARSLEHREVRRRFMNRLADDEALAVLRDGGVEALRGHYRELLRQARVDDESN